MIPDGIASWLSQYSALEAALTVIAIVGAIALVWNCAKRAWPGLVSFVEFVKSLGALPGFMSETRDTLANHGDSLAVVKHEVLPNYGGSMRDEMSTHGLRIQKIEAKLEEDHERFDELEQMISTRMATHQTAQVFDPSTNPPPSPSGAAASYLDSIPSSSSTTPRKE
jgi:hypothetical protein